ncbi:MAG: Ser-Thr-rich GPI-anchored membrane family protein [Dissulfurispiraceae bacterium]
MKRIILTVILLLLSSVASAASLWDSMIWDQDCWDACIVTLTVAGSPSNSTGTLTGGNSINCQIAASGSVSGTCAEQHDQGDSVTLTAVPAVGSYTTWSGCTVSSGNTCSISLSNNKTVTASFTLNTYTITATAGSGGTISHPGVTTLNYGGSQNYTITPNNYYGIQDVVVDGTSVGAVSEYAFNSVTSNHTIAVTFVLTYITVTSPNGGESWGTGSKQTIKWIYQGNIGRNVKIELLENGSVVATLTSKTSSGSSGQGSYVWHITQQPANDYKIRVTSTINAAYSDVSNGTFSIVSPPPGITVTVPNGGESWRAGTQHTITWTYTGNPGTAVMIQLLKTGIVVSTITSSTSIGSGGSGSYRWTIPSGQAKGTDYKIMIISTTNSAYNDTSNANFQIK